MVLVVDGASAEGATAPEGLVEGGTAPEGLVEGVTAPEGLVEGVTAPEGLVEGATAPEGSMEGVTAPEDSMEGVTADEAMGASSPVNPPEEGLRGVMVDSVVVMAGLGLDLVSPLPHGPTGMAITRTRPTTPLIPTLTTITRLHTIRMHTIRLRTMGVRQEAWVSSWEVLGEAAPLPAAVSGAISAGADLGNGKRSAFLSRNGSFCYEIVAVSDSSGPALRDRPPQASGEWALTPSRRSGTPLSLASRRGDRAEGRATRPHVLRRGLTFLLEIQCNPHTIRQDGALAY